jgi:hypothetical protein
MGICSVGCTLAHLTGGPEIVVLLEDPGQVERNFGPVRVADDPDGALGPAPDGEDAKEAKPPVHGETGEGGPGVQLGAPRDSYHSSDPFAFSRNRPRRRTVPPVDSRFSVPAAGRMYLYMVVSGRFARCGGA